MDTPLTVLSYGLGQDSTTLLLLALFDAEFRARYIVGDLLVVHADTNNEHPDSLAWLPKIEALCATWRVPFVRLTGDMGYHPNSWRNGLEEQYRAHHTIGMRSTRSCTDNLKIAPIYKYLDEYIGLRYGFAYGRKRALAAYTRRFGKLRVIIGFAKGEERRVRTLPDASAQLSLPFTEKAARPKGPFPPWFDTNIERVFPLIDLGYDRDACQQYNASRGLAVPPSNCVMCHHKSNEEILWTRLAYPDAFERWARLEEAKIAHWASRLAPGQVNSGVRSGTTLREIAATTYRSMRPNFSSDDHLRAFLDSYRFSHGHCVSTSY